MSVLVDWQVRPPDWVWSKSSLTCKTTARRTRRTVEYRTDDDKWEYISGSRRLPGSVVMSFPYDLSDSISPCTSSMVGVVNTHPSTRTCPRGTQQIRIFSDKRRYLTHPQELQADFQRQQQVLTNASMIEERDALESARSRLNGPASTTAHQNIQQDFVPQVGISDPVRNEHDTKQKTHSQSPQNHSLDVPKTGPDRSDEPEAWVPRARGRAD